MALEANSEGPTLRTARLEDLTEIHAIERTEFRELAYPSFVLRQLFELHGDDWVIADLDGEVAGYALVGSRDEQTAWILGLAVARRFHRRGYGRRLLDSTVQRCRDAPVRQLLLTVRPGDQETVGLYRRSGFEDAGFEEDYFGYGEARLVLACDTRRRLESSAFNDAGSGIWQKPQPGII